MTGMVGLLRAVSEQAKKNTAAGGPDIPLTGKETHIGRNAPKQPGLPLPMLWTQISAQHCIVKGDTTEGYTVWDTSTNGTFILADNQPVVKVPKGSSLPIKPGDTLRLSTVPSGNAANVLEYRLEYVADDTRVRKAVDSSEADGALPAKRLCMSNGLDSPNKQQEEGNNLVNQLMQTNRELKTKLEQERKQNAEVCKDLDAKTAEAQRLTADVAAARQQAAEDVAAATAETVRRCEGEIRELQEAKGDLTAQLEQQQQAAAAARDAKVALAADLEARQAELQELRQQLLEVQQQRDEAGDALHAVKAELQTKLDDTQKEAAQLREQLQLSAQDTQAVRKQAEAAREAQQEAQQEAEVLRQERDLFERETCRIRTEREGLLEDLAMLRDEAAVGERHLAKQLDQWAQQRAQWQRVADAQQAYMQACGALQGPQRQVEHELSKLGSFIATGEAGAKQRQPSPAKGATSGGPFSGTQHTVEVSSLQQPGPAPSNNGAAAAAWAGTQAASSSPAPANAAALAEAEAEPSQGRPAATAPSAGTGNRTKSDAGNGTKSDAGNAEADMQRVMEQDTQHDLQQELQHDSAPDAGTQLDDTAAPVPATAEEAAVGGTSTPSFEPGQAVDTLGLGPGCATGTSIGADTPEHGSESPAAAEDGANAHDNAASSGSGGGAQDGQGGRQNELASQKEVEDEDDKEEGEEEDQEAEDADDDEDMDEG